VTLPLVLRELIVAERGYRAMLKIGAGVPVTEVASRHGVIRHVNGVLCCLANSLAEDLHIGHDVPVAEKPDTGSAGSCTTGG
jgi:hypothetical protein